MFHFLGESRCLSASGWDDPAASKLWRYNQHYFDDLNARDAASRRASHQALVSAWIEANPAAAGTGWEPYPTSLRIVNWVKAAQDGLELDAAARESLVLQVLWLERRIEHHLLGNHLFANAKALVHAGLFFEGPLADRWLTRGLRILHDELDEQLLADGGHFERSPMYHALALEDLLDLINAVRGANGPGRALEFAAVAALRVAPMLAWLRAMTHPNGELAHFNDTANGIAPTLQEIEAYAARLSLACAEPAARGSVWLADSGYARVEAGAATALLDLAPLGPDYLPGHAHADTLSFEVSLGARRLIVNAGTSCYGISERRSRERGTAAHSTVQVRGLDSSEVWAGFRVGRRARVHDRRLDLNDDETHVSGWHDGYRHLAGAPKTWREWRFSDTGVRVRDQVTPACPGVARFLLAPGLRLQQESDGRWQVATEREVIATAIVHQGEAMIETACYAARFGEPEPVQCLAVALDLGVADTQWNWSDDAHTFSD